MKARQVIGGFVTTGRGTEKRSKRPRLVFVVDEGGRRSVLRVRRRMLLGLVL